MAHQKVSSKVLEITECYAKKNFSCIFRAKNGHDKVNTKSTLLAKTLKKHDFLDRICRVIHT